MIGFLLKFKQLNNMIENILSKPINTNFEMNMNDLPKDVEQKQNLLKLYDQLDNLSKYKDEIIWRVLFAKLELFLSQGMFTVDSSKIHPQNWQTK